MMKSEFENLIDSEVTEREFSTIDTVYLYYPGIDDKAQIAALFKIGGMVLINDLFKRADQIRSLEYVLAETQQNLNDIRLGA